MTTVKASKSDKLGVPPSSLNPELKRFMEEESKIVRGRFKNYETPGGNLPFCAGKYPGQPLFRATFQDGEVYEVPLWVARHLNGVDKTAKAIDGRVGTCSYPIHGFKWDPSKPAPESHLGGDGVPVPIVGVQKRKQRYGFESLEFDVGSL